MIRIYSIQARLCFIIEYGSPAPASASGGRGASAGADGRCAIDPAEDMLCLLYVAEQQWLLIERIHLRRGLVSFRGMEAVADVPPRLIHASGTNLGS